MGAPKSARRKLVTPEQFSAKFNNRRGYWTTEHLTNEIGAILGDGPTVVFLENHKETKPVELVKMIAENLGEGPPKIGKAMGNGPILGVLVLPAITSSEELQQLLKWPSNLIFLAGRLRLPGFKSTTPYDWVLVLVTEAMAYSEAEVAPVPYLRLSREFYTCAAELFMMERGQLPLMIEATDDGRVTLHSRALAAELFDGNAPAFTVKPIVPKQPPDASS